LYKYCKLLTAAIFGDSNNSVNVYMLLSSVASFIILTQPGPLLLLAKINKVSKLYIYDVLETI